MTDTVTDAVARREAQPPGNREGILALRGDQTWWTPQQAAALKSLGIKHATHEDLLVYFHYCQKTGLDPFSKQIYLLERRSKNRDTGEWEHTQTIQVGIDGFRVRAQRAARTEGVRIEYEDTVWFDAAGGRHEIWLDRAIPPAGAKVTVVKHYGDGTTGKFPGLVNFESYADYGQNKDKTEKWLKSQWAVMPEHMIEKCAEAFALRRAFPNDLGGLYIEEELQRTDWESGPPPKLRARRRDPDPQTDDEITPGEVVTDDTPDDPDVSKEALAKIAAVFREHGLGATGWAQDRLAVVTGLYYKMLDEPVPGLLDVTQLTAAELTALADNVAAFCDGLQVQETPDGKLSVKDQITAYARHVWEQVNTPEQAEA